MGIAIGALFSTGCHLAVRGCVLVSAWVVQQSQPVAAFHLKKEGRAVQLSVWGFAAPGSEDTFSTAEEAEYPRGLCQTMAKVVLGLAEQDGFGPQPTTEVNLDLYSNAAAEAAAGGLVKASKLPSIVPEFKSHVLQQVSTQLAIGTKAVHTPQLCIPVDSKVLQCDPCKGDNDGSEGFWEKSGYLGLLESLCRRR